MGLLRQILSTSAIMRIFVSSRGVTFPQSRVWPLILSNFTRAKALQ
jgi:hypothetical protein